jgi:hypothetical protein
MPSRFITDTSNHCLQVSMPTTMPVHHLQTDTFGVSGRPCPPTYGAASSSSPVYASGSNWCRINSPNTASGMSYYINDLLPRSIQNVSVLWAFPPGYTSSTCDWTAEI